MTEITRDIDKNDVDISALFKWNKEIEIEDAVAGLRAKFYMRLLGDADLNRARTHGYRKAADIRRKLKSPNSDERMGLLAELEDFSDLEIIIKSLQILRIQDLYQTAVRGINIPEPKEPSEEEKQEKWENYQREVDEYPKKFREAVDVEVEKLKNEDLAKLQGKTKEELYQIYESEVINKLCQEEMNNSFYDMSIYLATFKDDKFKVPAFKSFDAYDNIHPSLKVKLKEEYQRLEIGIELLKKLPEVTES